MYYYVVSFFLTFNIILQQSIEILTKVLSISCTKYETGLPVQETARPFGLSSDTLRIVPISTKENNKVKYLLAETRIKS